MCVVIQLVSEETEVADEVELLLVLLAITEVIDVHDNERIEVVDIRTEVHEVEVDIVWYEVTQVQVQEIHDEFEVADIVVIYHELLYDIEAEETEEVKVLVVVMQYVVEVNEVLAGKNDVLLLHIEVEVVELEVLEVVFVAVNEEMVVNEYLY